MENKYKLNSKGFVVVELVDVKEENSVNKGFTISPKFKRLANKGKLTKSYLLNMEYTSLLRCAMYPPAQDFVLKNLGIRGVPLLDEDEKTGNKFSIFPHQIETLNWMRTREAMHPSTVHGLVGGIVSLKMGLGKTLTALLHILSRPKGEFPALVIASKTVMHEWKSQGVEKFFGRNIKVLYLHKDFIPKKHIDQLSRSDVIKYDLVITTYDVCTQICKKVPYYEECLEMGDEHTLMKGKIAAIHCRTRLQADRPKVKGANILYCTPWDLVICDESQRYANPKTKIFKCIMALYGKNKWCLTGTIIRNYCTDVWSQLSFCGYTGVKQGIEWKRSGVKKMVEHKLGDSIFMMDYKDTTIKLPPKSEYFNSVELTGKHKIYYDWLLGETINTYDEMMKGGCSFACVLAMFTRLRQCAIAPYLTTRASKRKKKKLTKGDLEAEEKLKKRFANSEMFKWLNDKKTESGIDSCKIKKLIDILSRIKKDEKIIIFSMFTSCLDLLVDAIKNRLPDFSYVQVDGDVVGNERTTLLDKFRNNKTKALLMTYKVGSEGLNLTEANHCICIEPWWTNAVHNQAKARIWRPGQQKNVFIHNVLIEDSIEDKIMEICKDKDELTSVYLEGSTKKLKKNHGLDKYTLGKILGIR